MRLDEARIGVATKIAATIACVLLPFAASGLVSLGAVWIERISGYAFSAGDVAAISLGAAFLAAIGAVVLAIGTWSK